MPISSPKLDARLRAAAFSYDDDEQPIAEIWRRLGKLADDLGLTRPGYDTIRLLLRDRRRNRAELRDLLAPVVGDLMQGRFSQWDVDRLVRAYEVKRHAR